MTSRMLEVQVRRNQLAAQHWKDKSNAKDVEIIQLREARKDMEAMIAELREACELALTQISPYVSVYGDVQDAIALTPTGLS